MDGDISRYEDIINLLHHVSSVHPHMNMSDRAAQFAPFDALTGFSEAVDETAKKSQKENEIWIGGK